MPAPSRSPTPHRRRLMALVVLLSLATAVATYLQGALSVLSTFVIREFSISRSQLGLAFTAFSLTGGIAAPLAGRLSDVSTRAVMSGLFGASIAAILLAAAAPGYVWVIGAAFLGGLGLAAGNPVTNRLVSDHIPLSRRGLVVGVKQAGPPMGLLAAGLALPPVAAAFGWRWALAATALIPAVGLAVTRSLLPPRPPEAQREPVAHRPAGPRRGRATVWWLTGIGAGVAAGIAGVIAFVPLFAHEALGISESVAGLLAAVIGITGVAGRIVWGLRASRFRHPTVALTVIALVSVISVALLLIAPAAPLLVWLAVVGAGVSMLSWHAVSWLALMDAVDMGDVGRATGMVQVGNSAGFAAGPPLVGLLVDATGSYTWGWVFVLALFSATLVATVVWAKTLPTE